MVAVLSIVGCVGAPSSSGLIGSDAAKTIAARSTTSTVPVSVIWARLSTYGREASGTQVAPAETPVWAVEVTGSFPLSCGPASLSPRSCPPPLRTGLVLIDARTGAFIQARLPAPSPPSP
jgi:hypothetical protein